MTSSIVDKVDFLLTLAKKNKYDADELNTVISMTGEHTDNKILGRVFGYSVSDYAIAVLNWLGTEDSIKAFNSAFNKLNKIRQAEINKLIKAKPYIEY